MKMEPKYPNYAVETNRVLSKAPFISDLGIQPVHFEPGKCKTELKLVKRHLQQDDFVHAAVQAAMADHTAGAAASTLIEQDEIILTAEYKINFLRAAKGKIMTCTASVLKPGRRLIVAESVVYCETLEKSKMVSKAMITLAVVRASSYLQGKED
jgi:uncharacterized protein (TIGR00369 family)